MAIVKIKDKRTGTIYVYQSESYWDKEKKAPRNHRKLIGKLDEETGEIIPTGKKSRANIAALRPVQQECSMGGDVTQIETNAEKTQELQATVSRLQARVLQLEQEKAEVVEKMQQLIDFLKQ